MNKGIVPIYQSLIDQFDDDDNYDGTVYPNDDITGRIVAARAGLREDWRRIKTNEHPNLLRACVEVELIRVRIGSGNPMHKELLVAFLDKAKNNETVKGIFGDRITFVDDPEDPMKDGITTKYPWLGIKSEFPVAPPQFNGQREEHLRILGYIYEQKFPKQISESVIGV